MTDERRQKQKAALYARAETISDLAGKIERCAWHVHAEYTEHNDRLALEFLVLNHERAQALLAETKSMLSNFGTIT